MEVEREEEAAAGQVVHYRGEEGDHQTWLGKSGERPPKKIRDLLPVDYSPNDGAGNPRVKYSTSNCSLKEVPAMLKLRLGARYVVACKTHTLITITTLSTSAPLPSGITPLGEPGLGMARRNAMGTR